jgi:hypothetical protein
MAAKTRNAYCIRARSRDGTSSPNWRSRERLGFMQKISDYFQGSEKPGYSFIGLLASSG